MNGNEIAAKRLARGAITEKGLVDYLCKKGIDRSEAESIAREFREDGYIDDSRYSRDFFRYGKNKGWGKNRILMELKKKGVDTGVAKELWEEDDSLDYENEGEGEEERALQVLEKMMRGKVEEGEELDEKTRSRMARRLFSYGYSTSVIYRAIERFASSQRR